MVETSDPASPEKLPVETLAAGVLKGDRARLAQAITLIESTRSEHRPRADALLKMLHRDRPPAYRIGVTGLPGVGKSTFIDQFGTNLTKAGHRVAVLAVDPSSSRTGGSILGDKTRMGRLAIDPNAFVRPSPSGRTLGGVTRATRETMMLCEAAGFDVIVVETVGVGQSESAVSGMVDFFLLLLLPGAGDELQGIKKGIVELADMVAINKADGGLQAQATATAADYRAALHILTGHEAGWQPQVLAISARENKGLDDLWQSIRRHRETLTASGAFAAKRRAQAVTWMHDLIEDRLRGVLRRDEKVRARLAALEEEVRAGRVLPALAAEEVLALAGLQGASQPGS
jgi:LAO/AO transport system kinase